MGIVWVLRIYPAPKARSLRCTLSDARVVGSARAGFTRR